MTIMLNVAVTVTTVTFPYLAGTGIGVTILSCHGQWVKAASCVNSSTPGESVLLM